MDCQQIAETIGWLGETWGFWIQTGALFVSAVAGVVVIHHNGKQSRTRALIDLIVHQKSNAELVRATEYVHEMQRRRTQFSNYAAVTDPICEEKRAILLVLNNHEFVAVGIREGVFQESVYKEMQCSNVLKIWDAARGFVHEVRRMEGKETIFQDLEKLAERWKRKPIRQVT